MLEGNADALGKDLEGQREAAAAMKMLASGAAKEAEDDARVAALQEEIAALQAKIDDLEKKHGKRKLGDDWEDATLCRRCARNVLLRKFLHVDYGLEALENL